jgi:type I restriction enzyme, S subunit
MKVFEISDSQDHITKEAMEQSSTNLIPIHSVIVVFRSGILAHSFPVSINRVEVTINQDLKSLVPKKEILPEFLAYFLKSQEKIIINECSKFGATVHSIDSNRFFSYQIPIPRMDEQTNIIARIDKFQKIQQLLFQNYIKLQEKTKLLIPSIFNYMIQ